MGPTPSYESNVLPQFQVTLTINSNGFGRSSPNSVDFSNSKVLFNT